MKGAMNSFIELLNQRGGNFLNFAWPMLWQSSLLIAVLLALDFLLRHRLRAAVRYSLWLAVLLKLCLPPSLALPTSPAWWLPQTPPPVVAKPESRFTVTYENAPLSETPPAMLPALVPVKSVMNFAAWFLAATTAASAVLLGWLLVRWGQITQQIRRAKKSERLAALTAEAQKVAGIKFTVLVKLTANSMSPAVCGLFRPAILIPQALAENFSDEQLRAVLLHELIHLRRRDVWVNFLQALVQIFYWWHPLVWLANARIRAAREEAVDDAVMLALRDEAGAYAPTLLEVAKLALNRPLASLGLVGILESRHALRQRIERLVDFRAPCRAGLTLASLLGILAFTAVAVPMGEKPAPAEKQILPSPAATAPPAIVQDTNPPAILITASIYQVHDAEAESIVAGLKLNPTGADGDPWWSAAPEEFRQLTASLDASGRQPIQRPRIQTSSGMEADFFVGDGTNGIEFDCTPVIAGGRIELTIAGKVVKSEASEIRTNQFSAMPTVENNGGLVILTKNVGNAGETNVAVVIGVQILTKNDENRLIKKTKPVQTLVPNAASAPAANVETTTAAGILADTNFRVALHALEQRTGIKSLAEPEVTTGSGRGINQISMTNISMSLATAYAATSNPSTQPDSSAAKMEARGLLQDGKALYEMGKLAEAEVKLKAALKLDSENAIGKYYLGRVQTARQNSRQSQIKSGRQQIVEKLERIRLPLVCFDRLSLAEALRQLSGAVKQNDPENTGVNFLISTKSDTNQSAQINSVVINLPALSEVRLADVLDAMVLVADQPIKYSIQDYAVVFSAKNPADDVPLFSRTFKVDKLVFAGALRKATGLQTTNISALARSFFTNLGVNLELPKGKSVFYNETRGVLFVKATEADLDKIERAISAMMPPASQIHIKARFVTMPKGALDWMRKFLTLSNSVDGKFTGILTSENMAAVWRTLQARSGIEVLGEPEGTISSGRQMQMRATQVITVVTNFAVQEQGVISTDPIVPQMSKVETGPVLDVVPYGLSDGYTINLAVTASLAKFLGYGAPAHGTHGNFNTMDLRTGDTIALPVSSWATPSPVFSSFESVATVNLWDGQTVVLGGLEPNVKSDKELLVFITASIVDPSGNRVHADEDMPFAQKEVPPQPPPPK